VGLTGVIPKTRIGSRAYPIIEAGVPVPAVGNPSIYYVPVKLVLTKPNVSMRQVHSGITFQRRLDQLAGIHSSLCNRRAAKVFKRRMGSALDVLVKPQANDDLSKGSICTPRNRRTFPRWTFHADR
jgi:hypothetical protein